MLHNPLAAMRRRGGFADSPMRRRGRCPLHPVREVPK
jgi:hypothetical protein